MEEASTVAARVAELEARLQFLEQSQRAGRVGSWRARMGAESLLQLNDEARRLLGVEAGTAFRNLDFFMTLHPDDRERFVEAMVLVRNDRIRQEIVVHTARADGSGRTLLVTAAPVEGEPPEAGLMTGTIIDVTERRAVAVDIELQKQLLAENELRRAIEGGELFVEYQPVLELESGHFVGAEALVRWQHPNRGRLEPVEFVGLAEDSGLILPLGAWVLSTACNELRRWLDDGVPQDFVMAINLSGVQLRAEGLPAKVKEAINDAGVPGTNILLELTESVLVEGTLDEESLRSIRDLGVRVAIDDFGTKYSTLSYLARLPVDALKIDASFVHAIDDDGPGRAVVAAIAALGRALDLEVIAEGIETEEQLNVAHASACHGAQGFFISRPLPAEECLALVRGGRV